MLNVRLAGDHKYGRLLFTWLSPVMSPGRTKGEGWSTANKLKPPVISSLAVPRRHFYFGSSWLFFYLFVYGMLALWPPV